MNERCVSTEQAGLSTVAGADDLVVAIDQHDLRIVATAFVFRVLGVTANDDEITDMHESRGGAVQADHSGSRLATDGVRSQPIAIVDVVDVDLFPFHDIGRFHQQRIDRHTAFVVQAGVGHCGAVDLGLQENAFHEMNKQKRRDVIRGNREV